jgi:hypothetical protein
MLSSENQVINQVGICEAVQTMSLKLLAGIKFEIKLKKKKSLKEII